jgi:V/A-type H+-transporting ATPase subunit D
MNLLQLKRQVQIAARGLELLRSKRETLTREFFAAMERVAESRGQMDASAERAISALTRALGLEGRAALRSAGYAARRHLPIELTERNVWGVRFLEARHGPVVRAVDARGYAITGVSIFVDDTARRFEEMVELILRGVSVELRLKRLGIEIKKVTRRINALNEVVIPALTREVRAIRQALDEREREDLFRMKRFKQRQALSEAP